jgi:CheY-like chemotaxis protein
MSRATVAFVSLTEALFSELRELLRGDGIEAVAWSRALLADEDALRARLGHAAPQAVVVALLRPYEEDLERLLAAAAPGDAAVAPLVLLTGAAAAVRRRVGAASRIAVIAPPFELSELRRQIVSAARGLDMSPWRMPTPPRAAPAAGDCAVLLVEDDRDLRETVQEALAERGHRVFCAYNGTSALKLLGAIRSPCVVVLDLKMPGMDGYELVQRLRASPAWSRVPVVVTSALSTPPEGVQAFLPKPVDIGELLALVGRYCPAPGEPR